MQWYRRAPAHRREVEAWQATLRERIRVLAQTIRAHRNADKPTGEEESEVATLKFALLEAQAPSKRLKA